MDNYYSLEFNMLDKDVFRDLYDMYLPEIVGRQSDDGGRISRLKCINYSNHAHEDNTPSAAVYLNSGVYHCSVCGDYSAYRFLTELQNIPPAYASTELSTYIKDEKKFPKVHNFNKSYGYAPTGLTKFVENAAKSLNPALPIVAEYMATRGITYDTLTKAGIGYLANTPKQVECLTFPYYISNMCVAVRGRALDGRKGGIKGSRFVPYGLDLLTKKTCIICEGETDTLVTRQAIELLGIDASVVGIPGALFRYEFTREFSDIDDIIVLPQADMPSQKFALNVQNILGKDRVHISQLPWNRGEIGKDIADWLLTHNIEQFEEVVHVKKRRKVYFTQKELLEEAEKPVPYLIDGLLARGDKVLIGGEQKSMKTYFTLFMMQSLLDGTLFLEHFKSEVCNVLFVEEEGSLAGLGNRSKNVIQDRSNIHWLHKPGIKLDTGKGLKEVYQMIEDNDIDVVILDPLQRMHNQDEDSSSEMSVVWDTIHGFTTKYPHIAVIVIHHFRKNGGDNASWNSFRGSNRGAGEADLGIFITKLPKRSEDGETQLQVRFDGRDIPSIDIDESTPGQITVLIDTKNWTSRIKEIFSDTPDINGNELPVVTLIRNFLVENGQSTVTEIATGINKSRILVGSIINEELAAANIRRVKGKSKAGDKVALLLEWIGS